MGTAKIVITVKSTDITQRLKHIFGTLVIGNPGDLYATGGIDLKTPLMALEEYIGSQVPLRVIVNGSGQAFSYLYQYQPATGKLMVLQVPTAGSLVTAAPLNEIGAGDTLGQVHAETLNFVCSFQRNI
jgi:hypothetical protein